jgi:hypothetical protein
MIVYGASGRDVDTVLIDGHVIVRNGRVLTLNECEVVAMAAQARADLYGRAGWELRPDGAMLPPTSWLERYPNTQVAKWGARLARLQVIWNRQRHQ